MFRTYIDEGAFAPLVAEFRKWKWEWDYDEHLLELTSRLQEKRDWPLLKELWVAVVAKRRTNYNKTSKAQKSLPNKIPAELVTKTQKFSFGIALSTSAVCLRTWIRGRSPRVFGDDR